MLLGLSAADGCCGSNLATPSAPSSLWNNARCSYELTLFPRKIYFFLLLQSTSISEEAPGCSCSWCISSDHLYVCQETFHREITFFTPQPSSQPAPGPDALKGTQIPPRNLFCLTSSSWASGTSRSWPTGQAKLISRFCVLGPFRTHVVKAEGHIPRSGHVSSRVTSICCKDTAAVWFLARRPDFSFSFLSFEGEGRCWVSVPSPSPFAYSFLHPLGLGAWSAAVGNFFPASIPRMAEKPLLTWNQFLLAKLPTGSFHLHSQCQEK